MNCICKVLKTFNNIAHVYTSDCCSLVTFQHKMCQCLLYSR